MVTATPAVLFVITLTLRAVAFAERWICPLLSRRAHPAVGSYGEHMTTSPCARASLRGDRRLRPATGIRSPAPNTGPRAFPNIKTTLSLNRTPNVIALPFSRHLSYTITHDANDRSPLEPQQALADLLAHPPSSSNRATSLRPRRARAPSPPDPTLGSLTITAHPTVEVKEKTDDHDDISPRSP